MPLSGDMMPMEDTSGTALEDSPSPSSLANISKRMAAAERCVDDALALSGPCSAAECAAAPRLPLPAEQLRPDMPLCDDTEGRRLH